MVMELTNKDIKAARVNLLYVFKKIEENMTMIIREVDDIRNIQMKLLDMKSTISEMENTLDEIKEDAEEGRPDGSVG